jgi:hypothetical protein
MDLRRIREILNAGNEAAIASLSKRPQKQEYPRDFERLYEWLEENLYSFLDAKYNRNLEKINKAAGEIVMTASSVAEFSKSELEWEKLYTEEDEE